MFKRRNNLSGFLPRTSTTHLSSLPPAWPGFRFGVVLARRRGRLGRNSPSCGSPGPKLRPSRIVPAASETRRDAIDRPASG